MNVCLNLRFESKEVSFHEYPFHFSKDSLTCDFLPLFNLYAALFQNTILFPVLRLKSDFSLSWTIRVLVFLVVRCVYSYTCFFQGLASCLRINLLLFPLKQDIHGFFIEDAGCSSCVTQFRRESRGGERSYIWNLSYDPCCTLDLGKRWRARSDWSIHWKQQKQAQNDLQVENLLTWVSLFTSLLFYRFIFSL